MLEQGTPRQNVYACAKLSISGLFFSHTFQSDQSLPRALGFILCAACGSVVLPYAACVFDYFVVIEIAFMDNQAQITETISRLDSEKVRFLTQCVILARASGKLIFIHENKVFDCYFSLKLAETKT